MKETILLVDDEQGIRTVMGLSLRDAGYNVITVASGEEALQLFAERPIPIVITDIRMPGMNGLDLLKHIKILAPETEVILISGHADLETRSVSTRRISRAQTVKGNPSVPAPPLVRSSSQSRCGMGRAQAGPEA